MQLFVQIKWIIQNIYVLTGNNFTFLSEKVTTSSSLPSKTSSGVHVIIIFFFTLYFQQFSIEQYTKLYQKFHYIKNFIA